MKACTELISPARTYTWSRDSAPVAAVIAPTMVADTDDAGIAQMMGCNLGGTFYCCREAFRQMRLNQPSGGVIVNVG